MEADMKKEPYQRTTAQHAGSAFLVVLKVHPPRVADRWRSAKLT